MLRVLILKFLLTLTVQYEDVGNPLKERQLEIIADAIAQVSQTPEEAARLIAIGYFETGWNLRVHSGHCRKWECDHGRARGAWQLQKNGMPADQWSKMHGIDHTLDQATEAHKRIERYVHFCDGSFESVTAIYMGMKCNWRSKATRERAAFYQRTLLALQSERRR